VKFELNLAFRYFRAKRKSLARWTALVAIIGIAVGIASLIFAQSLARGFQNEMQEKILANTSHISVFHKNGSQIQDYQQVKSDLEKLENVKKIEATTFQSAILVGNNSTEYCVLRTIENRELKAENEVQIGKDLAEKTSLLIGEDAEIFLPNEDSAKKVRVRVSDFLKTGLYDYDSTWIYVSPKLFAYLSNQKDFSPTVLSLTLTDIYKAKETANEIRQNLSEEFKVVDWQEANQPLFAALSLEKKVSLAIISLIIFVATLNITTTLALLVNERKLDIAVLRTCGASTKSLLSIFLFEGLLIGVIGIVFGVIFGISACFAANYFKLISLEKEVYSLNQITLQTSFHDILLIISITFILVLLSTIFPAWKATKIKPLENLRTQ
jgi:lipoprotein-releasing system permease protein